MIKLLQETFTKKMRRFLSRVLKVFLFLPSSFLIIGCGVTTQASLESRKKIIDFNKKGAGLYLKDPELVEFKEKEKIKMVALGDSLTQGFFAVPFLASPGNTNENLKKEAFDGLSYPSVVAKYLESVEKDKIESYYNLSISGSKVTDWNYILSPESKLFSEYKNSVDYWIRINYNISKNKPWNFSENFKKFFLDSTTPEKFQLIRDKIKEANLILFSIGGNTAVSFFKKEFWKLISIAFEEKEIFLKRDSEKIREWIKKHYRDFQRLFVKLLESLDENLRVFIKKLKRLNPYANIVWVGYPFASWFLADIFLKRLSGWLYEGEDKKEEFSPLLWMFNKFQVLAKTIAKELKISFVSNFDLPMWTDFNQQLIGSVLDFHPSVFGQRRLAQNILLKVAAPAKKIDELQNSEESRKNWLFSANTEYVNSDLGLFRKEIYLSPDTTRDLFNKLKREMGVLLQSDKRWSKELGKNDLLPKFLNELLYHLEFVNLGDYFNQILAQVDVKILQSGEQQREFITKTLEKITSNKAAMKNLEEIQTLFKELYVIFQKLKSDFSLNLEVVISQVLQSNEGKQAVEILKKIINKATLSLKLIFPEFSLNMK